jgi:hypothetical protein
MPVHRTAERAAEAARRRGRGKFRELNDLMIANPEDCHATRSSRLPSNWVTY